ncbi:MAG: hypothetical protein ACE5KO_07200, partial [Candidatus Bathyarchaeia archaeon]
MLENEFASFRVLFDMDEGRFNEWYVPKFGSQRFRALCGLTFWPYTSMNVSYVVIGSALAPVILWDRVAIVAVIFVLALGVSGHALDALQSKVKPWGTYLSTRQLWALAAGALVPALLLGGFYAVFHAPLLWAFGVAEIFFLFAYNLEWFKGRFHTDGWFAFSWGFLPTSVGYVFQTNSLSILVLIVSTATAAMAFAQIKSSRPYKEIKRKTQIS